MATITVLTKTKNKGKEQPLWVMFRHAREEVPVSVGVAIDPKRLTKNGTVTGPEAAHVNGLVNAIRADLQQAYDQLVEAGVTLSKATIRQQYEAVKSARVNQDVEREAAAKRRRQEIQQADYEAGNEAIASKLGEVSLQQQIRQLQEQLERQREQTLTRAANWKVTSANAGIADMTAELTEAMTETGLITPAKVHQADLFVTYIGKYLQEQKNNLTKTTAQTYASVVSALNEFNPRLQIREVDRSVLYAFEDFLIKRENLNSTTEKITSQIKGVLNYYAIDLNMSLSYKNYKFKLPKYENDILHLSQHQLLEFWQYQKPRKRAYGVAADYDRMKDMFVFMCLTGLRVSDLKRNFRDHIKSIRGKETLTLLPSKTEKKQIKVEIQVTPFVSYLLEKHNYQFKWLKESTFRDWLKAFCSDLPSFQEEITWYESIGQEKRLVMSEIDPTRKPRFWEKLGTHSGRRTWINFAFQSKWSIPEIMGQSGHKEMNTLSIYASKARMTDENPLQFFENIPA